MDPPRLPCVNPFGLQDSPIKRSDSVASFKITSTQPNVQLQDASFTPIPKISMDRPVKYESPKDGRPSPKRPRPSSFDTTLDSSPVFSHAQSSPINSSPVIPIKQEKCQSPSSVRKPGQYIQLTPVQGQPPITPGITPQLTTCQEFEIIKLRAELSQLRLDFDIEKQQNEALRAQFDVERYFNEFLRAQTIEEQRSNKSLTVKITALEERIGRLEPTFVTLQHLKRVLLTWLRDYLVQNRSEGGGGAQQVANSQQ